MDRTISALLARRSIHKYKDAMPEREDIEKVIEAGLYAASGNNLQSSIIVAVTNRELRDRLSEMNRKIGGWGEGYDPFYGAPVVLIVLAERSNYNHIYDGSLTMGNMMQAAYCLGLGSSWVNRAREEFDTDEGKEILRSLGVEGDYEGIGHCILGYIDGEEPEAKERRPGRVYWAE